MGLPGYSSRVDFRIVKMIIRIVILVLLKDRLDLRCKCYDIKIVRL